VLNLKQKCSYLELGVCNIRNRCFIGRYWELHYQRCCGISNFISRQRNYKYV